MSLGSRIRGNVDNDMDAVRVYIPSSVCVAGYTGVIAPIHLLPGDARPDAHDQTRGRSLRQRLKASRLTLVRHLIPFDYRAPTSNWTLPIDWKGTVRRADESRRRAKRLAGLSSKTNDDKQRARDSMPSSRGRSGRPVGRSIRPATSLPSYLPGPAAAAAH